MIDEAVGPKNDFYIKLASEASMPSVLSSFYDEDGEFVSNTADYSIDVVGVLQEPTGVTITNDEGMEYPEMAAVDGWHVNIRLSSDAMRDAVEALDVSHGVTPDAPKRVWL
tara:strand:- start:126 stop:458 length:333 start_codon:yes stop_codon:yes gene_type:complete